MVHRAAGRRGDVWCLQMAPPPSRARQKLPMEKGYSQMDWMRLAKSNPRLGGASPSRPCQASAGPQRSDQGRTSAGGLRRGKISRAEVAQHATKDDAWTSLRGKVGLQAALPAASSKLQPLTAAR